MRLQLDTCTFLWISREVEQLSAEAKERTTDPSNEVFLSSASVCEIALKYIRGRLILTEGLTALPIAEDAALNLTRLPNHHNTDNIR